MDEKIDQDNNIDTIHFTELHIYCDKGFHFKNNESTFNLFMVLE